MSGPTGPFGNPTSSASGRGSVSGQANYAINSPFAAQAFGFGLLTGSSIFGGTSTEASGGGFTQTPSIMPYGSYFGASSSPAFGERYSPLGRSPYMGAAYGTGGVAFGAMGAPIDGSGVGNAGSQVAVPFGKSSFGGRRRGGRRRGSRVAPFALAIEAGTGTMPPGKIQSICSMTLPVYKDKSHEELRWEDSQWGDKGGPNHAGRSGVSQATALFGQTTTHAGVSQTTALFGQTTTPAFGQIHAFSTASSGFCGHLFPSNAAAIRQTNPSFSSPFRTAEAARTSGKSTSSAFKPQAAFGQLNNANNNPFVTTPFGSRTAGFVFGGTSTGVFRGGFTQTPVPLSSEAAFSAADAVPKDGPLEEQTDLVKASQKVKGVHNDSSLQNDEEYVIIEGASEPAAEYDCGAGIKALMPKLCQPDYYTEPHVKDLAAKERAEPGFCCQVKDFVVGRLGYGCIKFAGETDVRRLDLESLIRFNNREVIVYTDKSKKPPIGQGLNKPAEVTLLNIKCIDKKTGKQYVEGPKVEKYKETLKKSAEEQGAEFVSYDPIKGEWKFKVCQFS